MSRSEFETTRAITRKTAQPKAALERPYLVGISGEHAGRFFLLESLTELLIGRGEDCEVAVMLDDTVSVRHARVESGPDGEFRLLDLNSTNGTLVNGREITGTLLHRGDRIFLGQTSIFRFDYLSDEERTRWEAAAIDPLTDCHNRAAFETLLERSFETARTRGRSLAVLMIDVDYFKQVNDLYSHQAGDFALHEVASTLDDYMTAHAVEAETCRYGGEEFVVLVPSCDAAACAGLAEGLRQAIEKASYAFEGTVLTLTISIGTATYKDGSHTSGEHLVREADDNLYRAKREGRNRVVPA